MGYTHYWTIDAQVRVDEKKYNKALIDCRKVVKASPIPVEGLPQAGLGFNGTDDESHEDFWLDNPPNVALHFARPTANPMISS